MSGTPLVKPPRNNAEWARNTEKRQSAVEHPTSQRIGRWVLSEQADTGNLIASHVNGGSTVIAQPPSPSDEAGADEVTQDAAVLCLTKTTLQTINTTSTVVTWDGVLVDVGEWTSGVVTGGLTEIAVPVSGDYFLDTTLHFATGGNFMLLSIRVNGVIIISGTAYDGSGNPYVSCSASGIQSLLAGDLLSLVAISAPARNAGGSGVASPAVPSMFTATLLSPG